MVPKDVTNTIISFNITKSILWFQKVKRLMIVSLTFANQLAEDLLSVILRSNTFMTKLFILYFN